MQKLHNIDKHYVDITQSFRKQVTQNKQTLRAHYALITHSNYTEIMQTFWKYYADMQKICC